MSDGNSIKIPTWALPIGAAIVSGAIAWGSMQAQASATADEVAEIKVKVEEADTTGKLNAQAIEQITQSLAQMNETARDSDAKLQTLIELMIKQSAN